MSLAYMSEKFGDAARTLALLNLPIRERLKSAYIHNIAIIRDDDIPEEIISEVTELQRIMTKEAPIGEEGQIEATINKMSDDDAVDASRKIINITEKIKFIARDDPNYYGIGNREFIIPAGEPTIASMYINELPKLINNYQNILEKKEKSGEEKKEWEDIYTSYRNHLIWRNNYPQKTFDQQYILRWITTIMVVLLVLTGIIFSAAQLWNALLINRIDQLNSEVSINTTGNIVISSSVIGCLVLIISIAFFYLFLRYVFNIQYPVPPLVSFRDKYSYRKAIEKIK